MAFKEIITAIRVDGEWHTVKQGTLRPAGDPMYGVLGGDSDRLTWLTQDNVRMYTRQVNVTCVRVDTVG